MRRLVGLALVAVVASLVASGVRGEDADWDQLNPRTLPTPLEVWRAEGPIDFWAVQAGTVYTVGSATARALDARGGDVLWQQRFEKRGTRYHLLLLPRLLVVSWVRGEQITIALLDRETGRLLRQVELAGRVKRDLTERLWLTARLSGKTLEIRRHGETEPALAVDLDDMERDSDEDGLADVIERRLRLDPQRRDTDGDGISDIEDLAPNALQRRPRNEEDAIALAIFQQFYGLTRGSGCAPAVIWSDVALEWIGRTGPTITMNPSERRAAKEVGLPGNSEITIAPATGRREKWDNLALQKDDRVYGVHIYCGMLCAYSYEVVVRRVSGRWYIISCDLATIA